MATAKGLLWLKTFYSNDKIHGHMKNISNQSFYNHASKTKGFYLNISLFIAKYKDFYIWIKTPAGRPSPDWSWIFERYKYPANQNSNLRISQWNQLKFRWRHNQMLEYRIIQIFRINDSNWFIMNLFQLRFFPVLRKTFL